MNNERTISEEERQELLRQEGHKRNLEMIAESNKNAVKTSIADRIRFTGSMLSMAMTDAVDSLKPSPRKRSNSRSINHFPAQLETLEPIMLMTAAPVDLVTEDFSGDLSQWKIDTSATGADIHIENERLVSANLGSLVTQDNYRGTEDAPITVEGEWTPMRDNASNTHSMTLRLRNNGDANDYRGQNGVYLVAYTNLDVFIGEWKDGEHQKLAEDKSKVLKIGETYHFSVTDSGSTVTAVIKDSQGNVLIDLSGTPSDPVGSGEKIVLQSRERGMSHFDDIRISTLQEETVPEEEGVDIEAINEFFADPDAVADALYPSSAESDAPDLVEYKDQILRIGSSNNVSSLIGSEYIPENAVSLAETFEFENGTSYPNIYSSNNESVEGITFHSHADAKPLSFSNGLLIADGGYWETNVTFSTPTYVHAFSLDQISGGETAWIQVTYEDGTTFRQDAGRGGTFLINATIAKIYYDRGRSDGAFGIRDVLIAGSTEEPIINDAEVADSAIEAPVENSIPYSAMHVSVNDLYSHMFTVQYMSNHQQTYIEASRSGEPGMVFRQTIEHPGGEANGQMVLNPGNGNVGNHVRIWMYTDDTKTELLDYFEGDLGRSESNGVWGELEVGRTVENPVEPTIDIQKISGANILVSFSSPYDESRLELEGGGLFATKTVQHEGGEDMETVMLTFNTDKPEQNYQLRIFETRNNREIAGVTLHWDPIAKELSLVGENTDIPVEADSDNEIALNVMRDVFDAQTSLDSIDVSFASLRQVQGFHMYTASGFVIDPDNAAFYINQSAWQGHPDANGQFMQGLDAYEKILAELLQYAAMIKVDAMNGESQQPAIDFLQQQYNVLAYTQYILELGEFGITLPTVEQIRDEGIRIFEANTDDFKTQQIKNISMRKRVDYLSEHGEETGGGGGELIGEGEEEGGGTTVVLSEQEIEEHIQQTIADRVAARLTERLSTMTIEERANARGLLRLHQQGRLEEYLSGLLSGNTNEELEAELETQGEEYSVYYLIDNDVLDGAGHAALLIGSEHEGWSYFSFGFGDSSQGIGRFVTSNGNMEIDYFTSLTEAKNHTDRYDEFLRWDINDVTSIRAAFKEASSNIKKNYWGIGRNCDDIASDIIRAAGIQLDDNWFPSNTYSNNDEEADEIGTWNLSPLN